MDISSEAPNKPRQFTDHMKFKKEDQNGYFGPSLENKILTGANMEIKSRAETEGKATQRLSPMGIHSIYRHQTQTLLQMPSAC